MGNTTNIASLVVWSGFAVAFIFGLVASKTNFCTMGAVSDVVNMQHWGRMRMWLLAIAVAMIGTAWLQSQGTIDVGKSVYQRSSLTWLSHLVGGFCFGVGMTLASGCANKNLIRIGTGSLRSVVVVTFMALTAYATMKGLPALLRVNVLDPVALDLGHFGLSHQGIDAVVARLGGIEERRATLITMAPIALALLAFIFVDQRFRKNRNQVAGGIAIGLIIVAGWYISGKIGYGENPDTLEIGYFATNSRTIETLSFVAPISYTMELVLRWTDQSLAITFGIATAFGVFLGALVYAVLTGTFRFEGFVSSSDTTLHVIGGILMGFGGVTALGCTIGQGIAGVSTLSIGSILTFFAIVGGAAAAMKYIYWRETR